LLDRPLVRILPFSTKSGMGASGAREGGARHR
jgi:hypothetical protein